MGVNFCCVPSGWKAATVQRAPRSSKIALLLAYAIAALQSLTEVRPVHYTLELDGQNVETQVSCARWQTPGTRPGAGSESGALCFPRGRLLDVIIMNSIDPLTIIALLSSNSTSADHNKAGLGGVQHWRFDRQEFRLIHLRPPRSTATIWE